MAGYRNAWKLVRWLHENSADEEKKTSDLQPKKLHRPFYRNIKSCTLYVCC